MREIIGRFENLSRPTLEIATDMYPQKVRLPSGYTLYAFPMPPEYGFPDVGDYRLRVSVYPPGSDCIDMDDRVAELEIGREDADVLLRMSAVYGDPSEHIDERKNDADHE